jgi:hypothetical protein
MSTVSSLDAIAARWIELFDELRCGPRIKDQVAAPLLTVPALESRSILYVGKATSKDWNEDDSVYGNTMEARIRERRKCTRKFIQEEAASYNSGFWQFARELNVEAAGKWRLPIRNPVQHITWTNICKIGTTKGNPTGVLFSKQRDLAVETLRREIRLFRPQLICFATGNYKWDLVKEALGDSKDESWNQTGNDEWIWFRPATNGVPTALWTGHPERKQKELLKKWVRKATELLPNSWLASDISPGFS